MLGRLTSFTPSLDVVPENSQKPGPLAHVAYGRKPHKAGFCREGSRGVLPTLFPTTLTSAAAAFL